MWINALFGSGYGPSEISLVLLTACSCIFGSKNRANGSEDKPNKPRELTTT